MSRLRAVLGLMCLTACGDPTSTAAFGQLSQPIVGGTLDTTDLSVVALKIFAPSQTTKNITCSGSVISPHVVLTAGHCVDPSQNGSDATYTLNIADDIYLADAGQIFSVKETHLNPDFMASGLGSGNHDIGLVVTNEVLPLVPLTLNRLAIDDSLVGTPVRIIGYGLSDPAHFDQAHYGKRREAVVTVASVSSEFVEFGNATAGTCSADSGGPTMMSQPNGEVVIALHEAVISASCNGLDRDTRIDVYASTFIDPIIETADPGFLAAPDAGSPPDPDAGAGADGGSNTDGGSDGGDIADAGPDDPMSQKGGCSTGVGPAVTAAALLLSVRRIRPRRRWVGVPLGTR